MKFPVTFYLDGKFEITVQIEAASEEDASRIARAAIDVTSAVIDAARARGMPVSTIPAAPGAFLQ